MLSYIIKDYSHLNLADVKKVLAISHTDLDGVGSYLIVQELFKDAEVTKILTSYDDLDEKLSKLINNSNSEAYDLIFITDLCLKNMGLADKLNDKFGNKLVFLDHHKTSIESGMDKYDWASIVIADENGKVQSGTSLLMQFIDNTNLSKTISSELYENIVKFSETVRSYDSWEWSKNNNILAYNLNELLYLYGRAEFTHQFSERKLNPLLNSNDLGVLKGASLKYEQLKRSTMSKLKEITLKDSEGTEFNFKLTFSTESVSQLGNDISEQYPEFHGVMLVNINMGSVSFRTCRDDIDLTKIAKIYEGGGHAKACGCKLTPQLFKLVAKSLALL